MTKVHTENPSDSSVAHPGFSLGRWLGVEVGVDWSLLLIFGLITFDLGAALFPLWHPEWSRALCWTVGLCAALGFFLSVLIHELSHAVVGRTQGVEIKRITLFLFGGLAQMTNEPPSARAELLMAAVGPLTSFVIGVLATWGAAQIIGGSPANPDELLTLVHHAAPLATILLWLGPVNVGLALFNMVPGFPLDGGRVLRAFLWWTTGDMTRATRWASIAGRGFAWLLMAFGVIDLIGGAFVQGVWLMLIGWFLNGAAVMSYQRVLQATALGDLSVMRVMRKQVDSVRPDMTVDELVRDHLIASDQHGFPVEHQELLIGIVTAEDVRKLPHAQWPHTFVNDVMTPIDRLTTLPPDAAARQALAVLSARDIDQVPVVDHGHLLGLVLRRDLLKWIALHESGPVGA